MASSARAMYARISPGGTALGSLIRFTALAGGIVFGARKLEILQEMEKNGELPHQQENAGHSHHAHSVLETPVSLESGEKKD
eukprot:g5337.t1